jgi:hypothetical protein
MKERLERMEIHKRTYSKRWSGMATRKRAPLVMTRELSGEDFEDL